MKNRITNSYKAGKYFWQTANMIDDMDLSVNAFRLYCHLIRVSTITGVDIATRALAKACKISPSAISTAKQELVAAELISIRPVQGKYTIPYHVIEILDIERRNLDHCTNYRLDHGDFSAETDDDSSAPYALSSAPYALSSAPYALSSAPTGTPLNKEEIDSSLAAHTFDSPTHFDDKPLPAKTDAVNRGLLNAASDYAAPAGIPHAAKKKRAAARQQPLFTEQAQVPCAPRLPARAASPHHLLCSAIVQVTGLDMSLMGGRIGKAAKALLGIGATPEQVFQVHKWYVANDWRGKKGDAMTLSTLSEIWNLGIKNSPVVSTGYRQPAAAVDQTMHAAGESYYTPDGVFHEAGK